jgi:hypothetical protein
MSITDAARIDALFKKLQARTNTGKDIGLAAEASSISHVYSTQMGALPVPYPKPSDEDIATSYPWIVNKTSITYDTPKGAPSSYRAYIDSRVTNIIPYYPISVDVGGDALSPNKYILDFDTGAIVIYTTVEGAPTISFYQYKEDYATPRNLRTEAGKFVTGGGVSTSTTDEIDVYNSYYPVFFYVDTYKYGSSWAAKPFSLTIYRARDEDSASRGGMVLDVAGTVGISGESAPSLRWRYSNQAGVTVSGGRPNFVGGVALMMSNPGVVVWLRGRCTYRYHGTNLASRVSIQDYYGVTGVRAIANANLGLLAADPDYMLGVTTTTTWGAHSVPYAGAASVESYTGRSDTDAVTAFFRGTTAAWDSVTGLLVRDGVQTAYTVATGSCAPNAVDAFEVGSVLTTTKFEYLPTDIVVQGVSAEFYPVAFTISQTTHDAGSYEINIWRSNVHLDATYRGAVGLEVRGHLFNWGNDADYLNWTYTNRMNSTFTHFVADVQNATFNMAVVIWLRGGGTTYKFSGRGVSSIDSSVTSPKVLAVQSESFSKLTVANSNFTRNAGQWDSRTNLLILDGVINPPTGLHTDTVGGIATSTTSTSTTALAVNGRTTISTGGLTVSAGGADISGGVTLRGATTVTTGGADISGGTTLRGATTVTTGGLTVSAGGANITGATTLAGATTVTTGGLTVSAGGANITGATTLAGATTVTTGGLSVTGNLNHRLPVIRLSTGKQYSAAIPVATWGAADFSFNNTLPGSADGTRIWFKDANKDIVRVWLVPYPAIYIMDNPDGAGQSGGDMNVVPQVVSADEASLVGCYWYFVDRVVNPWLSYQVTNDITSTDLTDTTTTRARAYRQIAANQCATLLCIGNGNFTVTS